MKLSSRTQIILATTLLLGSASLAIKLNEKPYSQAIEIKDKVAQESNDFAIRNVRLFDGDTVIDRTDILVQQGKITAIGPSLTIPDQTPIYDGEGKTLIPGLIDAHTHSFGDARSDALRFGVTTELDMFNDWHVLKDAKVQRESLSRTAQADLWSAGILATAPGGHGTEYGSIPTINSVAEVEDFVQKRVDEGSDYLKIVLDDGRAYGEQIKMNTLTPDVTQALVNAAHLHQKKALFHIASLSQAQQAATQGADGLVHIFIDEVADQNFITIAKSGDIFIVPTLSVAGSLSAAQEGKAIAAEPLFQRYLTDVQRQALNSKFPPEWQNPTRMARAIESVKRLHEAGITILAGTDAGNPGTAHGASLHGELSLLVKAGLSPIEALQAATILPAKIFGLSDRGRIAVGLRADLVLLDNDPTRDIYATRGIASIWKNGYAITRQKIDQATTTSAPAPTDLMIADFEQEQISSRYGQGWTVSTDAMMQGQSSAELALVKNGAQNSRGALSVSGTIKLGFTFPWAGALFIAGTNDHNAVSFAQAKTLVFWSKGDGRGYKVMAFSSTRSGGVPPSQNFSADNEWREIRMPLQEFAGLDLTQVSALAFTAVAPGGEFYFQIDNIHIE